MHICLVTPRYPPDVGGVENHVERLAVHFAHRGCRTEVLTQAGPGENGSTKYEDGVLVRRFAVATKHPDYAFSPNLARFLCANARRYDVVHAHNYHALPAAAAAIAAPETLVFTPHYHGTSSSPLRRALHRPYRWLGRVIIHRARRVICVSGREAQLLQRDFARARDKIEVIHNGVDLERIRAAEPFDDARRVILSAGRLEPYKGVDRTIEAMKHLGPEYVLRITGDGSAKQALVDYTATQGLGDRVEFLGRVDVESLYRWFKTASVYVTMSRIEAMPLTPLEVIAAGAQVVASDIPAHREVAAAVGDSVHLVSPDMSPETIASAIAQVPAAVGRPPTVQDWGEIGDRTLAVYSRAAEPATGGAS